MNLRSQLLLAGALTLVVPLVGWQSAKQLYIALQQQRVDEQALKVATMRLALSESSEVAAWLDPSVNAERDEDWYAEKSRFPLFLDGYADDWQTLSADWRVYSDHSAALVAVSDIESALEGRLSSSTEQWSDSNTSSPAGDIVAFRLATFGQRLHWFIRIRDREVIYHRIPEMDPDAGEGELPDRFEQLVNGDAVELVVEQSNGKSHHGLFRAIAPGEVTAVSGSDTSQSPAGTPLQRWRGFWSRTREGYQLEVSMPLPPNGAALGVAVVDIDKPFEKRARWMGSIAPRNMVDSEFSQQIRAHARLFYASENVSSHLQNWVSDGVRARLFNSEGWLVADVNRLYTTTQTDLEEQQAGSFDGLFDAVLFRIFSFMVADDLPLLPEPRATPVAPQLSKQRRAQVADNQVYTTRYVTVENDRVLGSVVPIGENPQRAFLLLEANEEHTSAYTGSQLARLFSLLLLVSVLAGCGLLIFAMVLSSRIRRLSREAQLAVSAEGRVSGLTGSDAQDEIGDLSRHLSGLLSRSAQYNQYLETLSSRLSHELKTPLSVVRTSLENLDMQTLDSQSHVLVERAQGGAEQLGRIIKALVDSTRLEQSVQNSATEQVNLSHWLQASASVYRQIYPKVSIVLDLVNSDDLQVTASPELLQQAMDKLIENAVSFSTDGIIRLALSLDTKRSGDYAKLSVLNKGQLIDEEHSAQLFDPLVSHRETSHHEQLHLGIGLYMVKLIAESSGGQPFAINRSGWVEFGLRLPIT